MCESIIELQKKSRFQIVNKTLTNVELYDNYFITTEQMSHADTCTKRPVFSMGQRVKRAHSLDIKYSLLNYIINDVHTSKHIYHVYSDDKTLEVSKMRQ